MKKNNWIVLGIALIASIVLLAIWVFEGFNTVHMLDLMLAITWWIIIVASVIAFVVTKNVRSKDKNSYKQHNI